MLGRPPNVPRRRGKPATIELDDIQGNVLRGYTMPAAAYLWLRIVDVGQARALMRRMLPQVATAAPWASPPATALNVAFTFAGLRALGLPEAVLDSFPEAFREGMAARADRLGDRGPSAPEHWEPGFDTAHVLVTVSAVDGAHLRAALASVIGEDAEMRAVALTHLQRAEALPGGRDHFGFFDGIAQPAIQGSGVAPRPGDGQPDGVGGWREVATGEFLLGYRDEDDTLPAAPLPPFERNGTFVVYRKLAMDVAAFRRFVAGAGFPGGPDQLAAKIVGRWPDGTPLALSPDRPDPSAAINDFSYRDDPDGLRCPLGAHIRRANPRDSLGFYDGRLTNRHRIVRRGRSYGPPLEPGATEDDGVDRGLIFVCFQADIWRQFETIQSLWIDDGDPFGLGVDKDFLAGEPHGTEGKMTIQGRPPFFLKPQPRFVTLRGGGYLFQPSMTALRALAAP
ncbi:MAG TPA: Dyp-type peroxidase [Solirubrobacter sp.]|nr:Dyp-type peroxidase [Solirubrobacter sp.]